MLNLAETRLANKVCEGFEDLALVDFLGGGSGTTEPATNASSLLLIRVACEVCFVPPLLELPRPFLAKPKMFFQAVYVSGGYTTIDITKFDSWS